MNAEATNPSRRRTLRNIVLSFLVTLIFIAILFISAGSFTWLWGWAVAAIMLAGNVLGVVLIDPGLMEERVGIKSGTKRWDIPLATIMGRLGPLATLIVAGLDFRFGWSMALPEAYSIIGLLFMVLSYVPTLWAMRENRFFSGVVRIQTERGHHVVATGPYHFVRHPGYLGSIIYMLALPFALTSLWALIPAVIANIFAIVRTVLEDATLRQELQGYAEYAKHVRYRLLPGIW